MSDCRIRRQLALGAVQLFLLTPASLLPAGVVRAQDTTEPAALTLEMQAIPTTFSAVGEAIIYDLRLTNTGGVALDAVSVTDTMADVTCPSEPLEPGESLICTGSHTITQADLDLGSVPNVAQAHGTYGGSGAGGAPDADSPPLASASPPAPRTARPAGAPPRRSGHPPWCGSRTRHRGPRRRCWSAVSRR